MPLQIYNTTRRTISEPLLEKAVAAVLEEDGYTAESVVAVYCGKQMIRRINREFLEHDYPTDTITFRYNHGQSIEGEFYISLDVIDENARRFGATFEAELLRVTIHSVLHLIGYDDGTPEAREAMKSREDFFLERLSTV
jgi:probable rRNA maturation factor